MKLAQHERAQLQNILANPDFKVVELFLKTLAEELGTTAVFNTTEWDHIKGSLQKEFQIALLNQLVNLMEQAASDEGE